MAGMPFLQMRKHTKQVESPPPPPPPVSGDIPPSMSLPAVDAKAGVRKFISVTVCVTPLLALDLVCDLWRWAGVQRKQGLVVKGCMGGLLALLPLLGHLLSQAARRLWVSLKRSGRLGLVSKKSSFSPFSLLGD